MYRQPDEFQRTDISAAGSEWKANASIHSIIHDADHPVNSILSKDTVIGVCADG